MRGKLDSLRESLIRLPIRSVTRTLDRVDLLYDHLMRARATGAVFARTVVTPPWGLLLGGSVELAVHAVTRGRAWLWREDVGEAIELIPGEITLVRGGMPHHLAHEPGAPCLDPDEFRRRLPQPTDPEHGSTVFLCGAYRFAGDVAGGVVDALPPVLTLSSAADDPLREVISLLSRELAEVEAGQQTVLDRLLDVLLVLALRSDFRNSSAAPRWYRAAADPRLRDALQAMHDEPARDWTVDELAAVSGLSRAAYARTFSQVLGQPPLQYLTEHRMSLARDLLRTTDLGLSGIASRVGYGSPYSFVAAFRRRHGVPPISWRKQHAVEPLA
ncbi:MULTISPECIES: AraC family transcriptional regulator [unclassified Mycolicibacterium]|uniref:AraC family transcriptional regulator n=1 Tax=unclassified Mycolicibacterium TaxID=2636767 RepID=UPI001EE3F42F|nr:MULTISPECIES: AraC family transcriptional regulator [unclassified Mycolicibacterium]